MLNFFHKLFNPHCLHCKQDEEDHSICQSCETLKMQLAIANAEKQRMLDALLEKPQSEIEHRKPDTSEPKEVKPRMMTWNMRRQMLEAEDRKSAEILRKKQDERETLLKNSKPPVSTKELENLVGIEDAQTIGRDDGEVIQSGHDEGQAEAIR